MPWVLATQVLFCAQLKIRIHNGSETNVLTISIDWYWSTMICSERLIPPFHTLLTGSQTNTNSQAFASGGEIAKRDVCLIVLMQTAFHPSAIEMDNTLPLIQP